MVNKLLINLMNNNIEIFCVTIKRFNFSNDIKSDHRRRSI